MEIKFERFHLQSDLLSLLQGFERVSVPTEVRIDPLTRRRSRIITWGLPIKDKLDLTKMAEESEGCIFCPGNIFLKTPRFPKEIIPEERIRIGKAVGFPNLNPVGTYGIVVVLCQIAAQLERVFDTLKGERHNCLNSLSASRNLGRA